MLGLFSSGKTGWVPERKEQASHVEKLLAPLFATLVSGLFVASSASAAAPANTTPPNVSGTAKVGSTLTVSNGTWSNNPTSYTYQWQRCSSTTSCIDIGNAVGQSYVVRNADGGDRIRADVTATNADGQATVHSNMTSLVATTGAPGQHRASVDHR